MPDPADDRAAYLSALQRAEEGAGISRDSEGNEVYSEEIPVATELEGAVPIQASDQPLTPEPEAVEAEDTSVEQKETPAVVDDPLSKIAELEARLAEKDTFIGRQSTEIGDLRSAVEEVRQAQQEKPAPQAPAVPITQDLIDQDPARATLLAFSQGNQHALELAFEQWKDLDPFTAGQWLTDRRIEDQRREIDAKIAETTRAVEEKTAPLAKTHEEQQQTIAWAQAFDKAKEGRPDFVDTAEHLLTEVAPLHPSLLPMLQSTDPQVKADALIALYAIDKVGNPEALAKQLEEKTREAADEAAANRTAGSVVSGQPTAGQTAEEKTDEELEADAYISRMGGKPSLSRGWTGRSS